MEPGRIGILLNKIIERVYEVSLARILLTWIRSLLTNFHGKLSGFGRGGFLKTLITGAGGFIGSHLVERCVELGHTVRAFVHYNSNNSWGWLDKSPIKSQIEVIAGDIRDYDSVLAAMRGSDQVFHLAALIGIPYSYVSPLAYVRTNVEGTYNILQAARELSVSNLVVTSTSETYGTAQYVPMDEKHPMVGQSPYSASKIGADNLAISYFRSFGLPVKIARPFNTYGPRQSTRAIIPTIATQILQGRREIHLGNTTPTRDLTYVKDTVNGFVDIAKTEKLNGEYVNIGMAEEISVGDLAQKIAGIIGTDIKIVSEAQRTRPVASEVERLYCSNQKIRAHSSWKPQFSLDSGLQETIEWIREHLSMFKAGQYHV